MVTAATSREMTLLMLASVSASPAVFYWRDWQKAIQIAHELWWQSQDKSETDSWAEELPQGEEF